MRQVLLNYKGRFRGASLEGFLEWLILSESQKIIFKNYMNLVKRTEKNTWGTGNRYIQVSSQK